MTVNGIACRAKSIRYAVAGRFAPPYSQLYLVTDDANWVLKQEMQEVAGIAGQLGIRNRVVTGVNRVPRQATFHSSQHILIRNDLTRLAGSRIGLAYFHGLPATGNDAFDRCYEQLCRHHKTIDRVQVSHTQMRDVILESGISPDKVHLIRIAINTDHFPFQTPQSKRAARDDLGLPQSAVIVGSFQKDGNGWGEGLEPKRIKGPDVLCDALTILKQRVPELHVLLTGPARGYVKRRLDQVNIPYTHRYPRRYSQVGRFYQALDAYMVASRQEGGPKAIFEAMSSGVPIISTRVGQAMDVVEHGVNGSMVESEDAQGLAHWTHVAVSGQHDAMLAAGRTTALRNTYHSQVPLWAKLFNGFAASGTATCHRDEPRPSGSGPR